MSKKNNAVFGIFRTRESAEEAVTSLLDAHFRSTDISALLPDNIGTKDLGVEKNTKAGETMAVGATGGGVVGGILGLLVGMGTLVIPDARLVAAAGPIVASLAGVGVGGTLCGLVGALLGLGIPEYEAKRYEGRVKRGCILLSVHCDSREWIKRAEEILEHAGAEDISTAHEAAADFGQSDRPGHRTRTPITPITIVGGRQLTEHIPAEHVGSSFDM
jgi:hypothetical protein